MSDFDPEEMGAVMTTIVGLIAGFAFLFFGFLASLVFWPAGALVMALGGLFLLAAPLVGIGVWYDQRGE
ncbi:hypothetical protein [Halorubrum tebenquichense]|uniref:Uncharacterized protein n=1 Tax=Halorubrum tebenquichense DSM 14210 TaxID=1227485 RepID=M0DIP8_9EURY|nr:hypothetical protein [Halorubrum tebenquichense]ELZ35381.1 hypothetical protein C472_12625 [Halorubrum tebenquichense DSM 14210]